MKQKKKEVNLSVIDTSRWRLSLFSRENDEETFLKYGEIIWIHHAEHNASMIIKKEKNSVFDVEFVKSGSTDSSQEYIGDTNGMWIIEHENYLKGGLLQWENRFRLKHFSSEMYLSLDEQSSKLKLRRLGTDKRAEDFLFKFALVSTTITEEDPSHFTYISKEAFTRIRSASNQEWLHVKQESEKMEAFLSEEFVDDDIFKIFKANSNEVWETSFLISCLPILRDYLRVLEENLGKVSYFE